ncbi:hypothetical protein Emed_004747 [Eimeria media]
MLLIGLGALAAAGAALLLPVLLYHYFVDNRKSNTLAAFTFCCTLTFALLLALLVPIDIVLASSTRSSSAETAEEVASSLGPSVAEAAAAAHASNVSSAFTPASAAAAAAAAAGWAALKNATLPLTSEHLQRMYLFLGLAAFFCCFVLTPAAIFYATELNKRQAHDVDDYDSPPCDVFFPTLKKTFFFMLGLGAVLLVLLSLRPGMPSPSFFKPGEVIEQPALMPEEQEQQQPSGIEQNNVASIMAAAAAAASAAAASATAAATRAAAAARRVDSEAVQIYTAQLLGVQKAGVDSLLFLGACFLCAGESFMLAQVVWTIFGAFGLVALPFKWLRRGASTQQQQREVQQKIASLRDEQRRIQSKYAGNMSAMTFADKERLEMLKAQQCFCTERNYKLQEAEQGRRPAYSVLCRLMLPFRRSVGLSLLALLLLMLFSLGTVLVRRLEGSQCGWACGFAAHGSEGPPTLADATLMLLSSYPPADLWLVSCWLLLLLFGGLCGLLEILPPCLEAHKGASELKQHVQSVRGGGSSPQVLLLLSALLAHHILAAGLCIFTVAPQYASFGNQTFVPHNGSDAISCSLHAAASGNTCRPTIFAAALSRVAFVGSLSATPKQQLHRFTVVCAEASSHIASPMLASISYCSSWAFLVVAVSCLVYFAFSLWHSPNASRPHQSKSAEDLEDMAAVDESARLLGV